MHCKQLLCVCCLFVASATSEGGEAQSCAADKDTDAAVLLQGKIEMGKDKVQEEDKKQPVACITCAHVPCFQCQEGCKGATCGLPKNAAGKRPSRNWCAKKNKGIKPSACGCTLPSDTTGYDTTSCDPRKAKGGAIKPIKIVTQVACQVVCAPGFIGTATATCPAAGGSFTFEGCFGEGNNDADLEPVKPGNNDADLELVKPVMWHKSASLTCLVKNQWDTYSCKSQEQASTRCKASGLRLCEESELEDQIGPNCEYMWTSSSITHGAFVSNGHGSVNDCGREGRTYRKTETYNGVGRFNAACCQETANLQCPNGKYMLTQAEGFNTCLSTCPPGYYQVEGVCQMCKGQTGLVNVTDGQTGLVTGTGRTTCAPCQSGHVSKVDSDGCQNIQDTCSTDQCAPCQKCMTGIASSLNTCSSYTSKSCYNPGTMWCAGALEQLAECQGTSLGCWYSTLCSVGCICDEWKAIFCGGRTSKAQCPPSFLMFLQGAQNMSSPTEKTPSAALQQRKQQQSESDTAASLDDSLAGKRPCGEKEKES